MKRWCSLFLLFFTLGLPVNVLAGEMTKRWASGAVTATNTSAVPNTIVVKAKNWKGKDFIIGADVDEKTEIKKGDKTVSLNDIKEGDMVSLVYERNGRLVAKSIKVK